MKKANYDLVSATPKVVSCKINPPNMNVKDSSSNNYNPTKHEQSKPDNYIKQTEENNLTPKHKDAGMLDTLGETITDIIGGGS